MRFLFLAGCIACAALNCTAKTNIVRLSREAKTNGGYLTLTTEHYLSLDGDRVLELDRGVRLLTLDFRRSATIARPAEDAVLVSLKLYDTDAVPKGKLRFDFDGKWVEFEPQEPKRERFEETVTVLDTGQRQQENPNLANSAQAQTGYITFGKPAAAGAAKRLWLIYRFKVTPESALLLAAMTAKRVTVSISVGSLTAEAQVGETEMRAWRKYAKGDYDEKSEDGGG